jgi:4-alpha-glucanotransferase
MSSARLCILPAQDILTLGENARINNPGLRHNNWLWRLVPEQLTPATAKSLALLTKIYGRA